LICLSVQDDDISIFVGLPGIERLYILKLHMLKVCIFIHAVS